MSEVHLLVFGDQTETAIPMDELLQYSDKSKYISQYLQDSFIAVQNTLDSLSDAEKERLKFDSFQSLAEKVRQEKTPDIVLRTLILCVAQLGSLIVALENDSDLRNSWASQNVLIVASCAGQVPAAAAATTHSLDDLVAVAPEIVAISLRVGLDVDRRSAALSDDRNGSWARAVIGVSGADAQASIDEFHKAQGTPESRIPYVGATSAWATTIFGPPATLESFLSSKPFGTTRVIELPVAAVFHAASFDRPDTEKITGPASILQQFWLKDVCFLSSEDGVAFKPQRLDTLVSEAELNMLNRMTDNEKVFGAVKLRIKDQQVAITPIVATKISERLKKALGESNATVRTELLVGGL
ncbi:uncharacterized protein TrAtP1_007158 [Trichoderma atroviride]|uniref:Starter acyltransferase (SAT) domain-containing protein n=1 Tax=Hypocrea atroviridis (strain ATCC 20476 / IMI 206040) TaxID=452589 RepID=G9PBZ4_HYPAI|nr:uncharacterized protein TRIATDRAFT_302820 [Trichoderma atroviride IMI 206040]EHK39377.1 hypothetical protein TRIATDRAFT_302820 [Trichoderma atroviride IMI 206040]UKZ65971.1 hypothetical protein TrAtP1_007158 [Trichoderma atroviride]